MTNTDSEIERIAKILNEVCPVAPRAMSADEIWRAARFVSEAYRKWLDENGYVIAPKEPGDEGSLVGARSIRDTMHDTNFAARARDCYRAMISTLQKDESKS